MTQKYTSFNDLAIVTAGRNDYRIRLWGMTKSEAVSRMKNADLSEKSRQLLLRKKLLIILMTKNTPETMALQQRHREEKQIKSQTNI